ncbi:hypothetical protein H4582DRAFT_227875 [Lactarius indigo]|nr:hypothetical protein H4582DRAFT_316150 [Lactarius indigo]KAI9437985.1 hypothetical protein H4582DRAFT_227875 [Lactarius indigo]
MYSMSAVRGAASYSSPWYMTQLRSLRELPYCSVGFSKGRCAFAILSPDNSVVLVIVVVLVFLLSIPIRQHYAEKIDISEQLTLDRKCAAVLSKTRPTFLPITSASEPQIRLPDPESSPTQCVIYYIPCPRNKALFKASWLLYSRQDHRSLAP